MNPNDARTDAAGAPVERPVRRRAPKKKLKTYRVFVAQVNQACVWVKAENREEARDKGYAKWRRHEAHSFVCSVEEDA